MVEIDGNVQTPKVEIRSLTEFFLHCINIGLGPFSTFALLFDAMLRFDIDTNANGT